MSSLAGSGTGPAALTELQRSSGSSLYVQADTQFLPLPDGCVERVMANHMLYHVRDQERALREMCRVLAPGGRIVLTTNGAEFMRRFQELHDKVACHFDYTPDSGVGQRFTMEDLQLVRRVFPTAEREVGPAHSCSLPLSPPCAGTRRVWSTVSSTYRRTGAIMRNYFRSWPTRSGPSQRPPPRNALRRAG